LPKKVAGISPNMKHKSLYHDLALVALILFGFFLSLVQKDVHLLLLLNYQQIPGVIRITLLIQMI
jgi:hypothetical protein